MGTSRGARDGRGAAVGGEVVYHRRAASMAASSLARVARAMM